ncbi:MAG: hypothetical protein U9R60_02095 [Bacteroidota bacterium]|nr:hypothetical protein [Bacteroidota bacterium]
MFRYAIIIFLLFGTWYNGFSKQIPDTVPSNRSLALKVFIDCGSCDLDYFKENFTLVNYVQDRKDADVHILVSTIATGGRGTQVNMLLKGQQRFHYMADTLIINFPGDVTLEEWRVELLRKFKLALVPYLLKTSFGDRMSLQVEDIPFSITDQAKDRWRNWIFEISGAGSVYGQKSARDYSINTSFYISKITPDIKIESINHMRYEGSKLSLYDGNMLIYSSNTLHRNFSSTNLIVKSLGEHGGIGGIANFMNSSFYNLDFQMSLGPAIEANLVLRIVYVPGSDCN